MYNHDYIKIKTIGNSRGKNKAFCAFRRAAPTKTCVPLNHMNNQKSKWNLKWNFFLWLIHSGNMELTFKEEEIPNIFRDPNEVKAFNLVTMLIEIVIVRNVNNKIFITYKCT